MPKRSTATISTDRQNHETKQIAGIIHKDRRKQKHLDRVAIYQCVTRDHAAGRYTPEHAGVITSYLEARPTRPSKQNSEGDQHGPGRRQQRRVLVQQNYRAQNDSSGPVPRANGYTTVRSAALYPRNKLSV